MRFDRWTTFWVIATLGFFGGSIALVFTGDETGTASAATSADPATGGETSTFKHDAPEAREAHAGQPPVIEKTDEGCLADASTLADLRRQKTELETRQKELIAREAELKVREQALSDQMKGLASARDEIQKTDQSHQAESDAKVAKLVEAVENMNPKAAAGLLASIDETLATATMAKLTTGKLAKVLNVMDPARSTKLSELLAGVARAKTHPTSHDVAVATTERAPARASGPSKGGDTNDGKSHEQASSRTTASGSSDQSSR